MLKYGVNYTPEYYVHHNIKGCHDNQLKIVIAIPSKTLRVTSFIVKLTPYSYL